MTIRYHALNGWWRWVYQHGVALRDEHGRSVRMIGSTADFTELREHRASKAGRR